MRIRNVSFAAWLKSHGHKDPQERWLRELYPWPVFSQIDYDEVCLHIPQTILYDDVRYCATLRGATWQPARATWKYRFHLHSAGLGWHARSFDDEFDLCATSEGEFVTLFHRAKDEPLERVARAFFDRQWDRLRLLEYRSLASSRFLAAALSVEVALRAYADYSLAHYPDARLIGGGTPILADGHKIWISHSFFSEDAYSWARKNASAASEVRVMYFADTKYQFLRDLPPNAKVHSVAELDATLLGGEHYDLILALARGLDLPSAELFDTSLEDVVRGVTVVESQQVTESDVHEALAALRRPCEGKEELRYQLAAGVVLNAWIQDERALGHTKRKAFYAFKARLAQLAQWAVIANIDGVSVWLDHATKLGQAIVYFRIDGVDFSYHSIPVGDVVLEQPKLSWTGVRLKPIAPIVLKWARFKNGAISKGQVQAAIK
jgi:hypothetical protein